MADVVKVSLRLPREVAQAARIKALLADVPLEAVMEDLLRGWVGQGFMERIRQVATEANGQTDPVPGPRRRTRGRTQPAEGGAQA